jgi:hypothetical protein
METLLHSRAKGRIGRVPSCSSQSIRVASQPAAPASSLRRATASRIVTQCRPVRRSRGPDLSGYPIPIAAAGWRYVEFFTANIRNPNTRRAYAGVQPVLPLVFAACGRSMSQLANSFRRLALRSKKSAWLTSAETVARW